MSTAPSDQPDGTSVVRYVVPVEFKARFDQWLLRHGWEAVLWPGEDVTTYVIRPVGSPISPPGLPGGGMFRQEPLGHHRAQALQQMGYDVQPTPRAPYDAAEPEEDIVDAEIVDDPEDYR